MKLIRGFLYYTSALAIGLAVALFATTSRADIVMLVSRYLADTVSFISVVAGGTATIGTNSVDTADSNLLCLSSTPQCTTNGTRGGYMTLAGNENGDVGSIRIQAGLVANTIVSLYAPVSSGKVTIGTNNPNDWEFARVSGATVLRNAAGGGDVSLSLTGTTLAVQEGTAASACMGSVTANGTTAVTVSTTCATAGTRPFISRSSAPSGTADCWTDTLVAGTSFNLDCNGAETGTFNWIIYHEAP